MRSVGQVAYAQHEGSDLIRRAMLDIDQATQHLRTALAVFKLESLDREGSSDLCPLNVTGIRAFRQTQATPTLVEEGV